MADIWKRNSGTDLSLTTSWSDTSPTGAAAASIPDATDIVIFDTNSTGGSLSNAVTGLGYTFNTASAAPTFLGTVTIGSSGITQGTANALLWSFNGTVSVGTADQIWTLYRSVNNTVSAIQLGSAGNISGSANITLQSSGANNVFFTSISTACTFSGKLILGNNTRFNLTSAAGSGANAGLGNAATIQVDGTGAAICGSSGYSTCVSNITLNNTATLGATGANTSLTVSGNITYGSGGAYTLTTLQTGVGSITTISGALDLSSNSHTFIAASTSTVTLSGPVTLANSPYSNTIQTNTSCTISSTNTVNFGTGAHTINASSSNIAFSGILSGSNGFTKSGGQTVTITNTANTLQGSIAVSAGSLTLGGAAVAGNVVPNVTAISTAATTATVRIQTSGTYSWSSTLSGSGNFLFQSTNATGITTSDGVFGGLANSSASIGAGIMAIGTTSYLNVNDFPALFCYYLDGTSTGNVAYVKASPTVSSANFNIDGTAGAIGTAYLSNSNASSSNTLTLTGAISVSGTSTLTFGIRGSNSGENTISGVMSNPTGKMNFAKLDAGTWKLTGTNTYTGSNTLTNGNLIVANNSALGAATGDTSTLTAGKLILSGSTILNKSGTAFITNGTSIESSDGLNAVTFSSLTMNASFSIVALAGLLEITNPITTGGTAQTLTITGPGLVRLSNTGNSYVSSTAIQSGVVYVNKLANAGTNSSLGAPAAAQATITMGAGGSVVFVNIGSTVDTTDRSIVFTGGNLTTLQLSSGQTGNGSSTYSSGGTLTFTGAGSHTLALDATNTATNTLARTIADGPSGATNIFKVGPGTWSITGAISATGSIASAQGLLDLGSTNRTFSGGLSLLGGNVSISTGNTIAANVIFGSGGGTLTGTLVGANTVTVGSNSTEINPAVLNQTDSTGSNTFTGAVTVHGCVDLITPIATNVATAGNGRVLGTSNTTTVSSTGIIRTRTTTSSDQRGRARYNNLTLQAGSKLKIGFAA